MSKKTKAEKPQPEDFGAVLYTDGGCRPSRGKGGWGVHGYTYTTETDELKHTRDGVPTSEGYTNSENIKQLLNKSVVVQPWRYVDAWGGYGEDVTNNYAELTATLQGLKMVCSAKGLLSVGGEEPIGKINKVQVLSDSQYVINGIKGWSAQCYKHNNWLRDDGSTAPNWELWKQLHDSLGALREQNVKVNFQWTRGHSGFIGNERADFNATRGIILSKKGIPQNVYNYSPGKGYNSDSSDYNRMFALNVLYFNTNTNGAPLSEQGRWVYFLGNQDADDVGFPKSDDAYAVIHLKEPDPVIEKIREEHDRIDGTGFNNVVKVRLDTLFVPSLYNDIKEYGCTYLQQCTPQPDLYTVDEVPISWTQRPARKAFCAIDTLSMMDRRLVEYIDQKATGAEPSERRDLMITDLTELVYIKEINGKGKENWKVSSSIAQNTKAIDVMAKYWVGEEPGELKVTLTIGIDLPKRNALSALADKKPRVSLITWRESSFGFRVATIVETDDDIGIYAPSVSNLRMIPSKEDK